MMALPTTLNAWIEYWESASPQAMRMQIAEVQAVGQRLGLLEIQVPVVTVAGTNGKGSTVATLTAIYKAAGFRVGSYTSPHLLRFNERICLSGIPISDNDLMAAFTVINAARVALSLTLFEVLTLAALYYFRQQAVDVILLEVGLGGRLDATNIVNADLVIFTTIAFDHQAILGNTLDDIGREKAGVLRHKQQVIYADIDPPRSMRLAGAQHQVTWLQLNVDYSFKIDANKLFLQHKDASFILPRPNIQPQAAACALIATRILHDKLPVTLDNWRKAMLHVMIPARQQVVAGLIKTVYDVSHNEQSVQSFSRFVSTLRKHNKVHAVFSCLHDKDVRRLIELMQSKVDFWYPACLDTPRAVPADELGAILYNLGVAYKMYPNPAIAYVAACRNAVVGDVILVYGSFFTVSAVMVFRGDGDENGVR